jgi:hypothetical protein
MLFGSGVTGGPYGRGIGDQWTGVLRVGGALGTCSLSAAHPGSQVSSVRRVIEKRDDQRKDRQVQRQRRSALAGETKADGTGCADVRTCVSLRTFRR